MLQSWKTLAESARKPHIDSYEQAKSLLGSPLDSQKTPRLGKRESVTYLSLCCIYVLSTHNRVTINAALRHENLSSQVPTA
jgi:hypothetical protein